MEIMSLDESMWEYCYHRSSFLPESNMVESDFTLFVSSYIIENCQSPIFIQGIDFEGNLCNVTHTFPIDISVKLGIVEHVHVG